ncbi:MATE family multidrug resistance protein [Candidatus Symbiobacter mobilis CR]|uniref:MATE family multidrug resistance protein n=2 Tax=Candidatus Symbiobacter TaxID=1436289 RepID=U5NA18_9BURK|nr:MATE family multidrug resistance protein [Candidatus Symbiobacter mobilis CR]
MVAIAVVDVAMAGHASATDLAGVSLGAAVWNLLMITVMGVIMSVHPAVAHLSGANNFGDIPGTVRQALWMSLGVGGVAAVLANAFVPLFAVIIPDPAMQTIAAGFVHITSAALPLLAMYRVLVGYSTSINQTYPLMVVALLGLLFHFIASGLLVFGVGGWPGLGGLGCAWATLCTVALELAMLWYWMRRSPLYRDTCGLDRWEAPRWADIHPLLRLGLPIGVTYFAEASAFSLIALLIAGLGSIEVAAHQIALNFSWLIFTVPLSLGLALLTRVGQSLGANDPDRAAYQSALGLILALGLATLGALLVASLRMPIARLYTDDAAVVLLAADLLLLAAYFQWPDALQVVASCAIRGYKVTRPAMVIHLAAFWGVAIPLGYLLGLVGVSTVAGLEQPLGARGFWMALIFGLTTAALGLLALLRHVSRQASGYKVCPCV